MDKSHRGKYYWVLALFLGILLPVGVTYYCLQPETPASAPKVVMPPAATEASIEQIQHFCGKCHPTPPADSFPRSAWRHKIKEAYDIFRDSSLRMDFPSLESVAAYYEKRAPKKLPPLSATPPDTPLSVQWERQGVPPPDSSVLPMVANVNLVQLLDDHKSQVLVCEARANEVRLLQFGENREARWQTLARLNVPAHTEVVDLDGNGIKDILVACLGEFYPTDARTGSVVWLQGKEGGAFSPITLLEGVGRVADVQAADFNGDGKKDLLVAVFGWQNTGEILYLENHTTNWERPVFQRRVLDERHGTIHVPVIDLNDDGRPDFVALISQEHETVVAFLNRGKGNFEKKTLFTAPHPGYGYSGIQLVDLDSDGNLDILLTNGDGMDPPALLKPYHGISWLRNRGSLRFEHQSIAAMYGVQRAVAVDCDGDGDRDIVAVSCLPGEQYPQRKDLQLDAVLFLEQKDRGRFVRHVVSRVDCNHFTGVVGDVYGDGKMHLVAGNFTGSRQHPLTDAVVIWKNVGAPSKP